MRGDRVHNLRRLAVSPRQLRADDRVRALDLVVDRLADVVQQRGTPRLLLIQPELRRHVPADERRFDRMKQDVLRVAVAIFETPQQFDQLRMDAVYADVEDRLLSGFAYDLVELLFRLTHDFLDPARMDASVGEQFVQRHLGDLATGWIVSRDHDRLVRVIDDEIDAGRRLPRAAVPPLAADDAALDVVARQRHDGHRALGDEISRQPLDRERDDLLAFAHRFLARLLFDNADALGGFVLRLFDHLIHKASLRFLVRHAGDPLDLLPRLDGEAVVLGLFVLGVLLACLKRLLASLDLRLSLFDRLDSLIQTLLFANQALFQILQLSPRLAQFFLEVELRLDVLLFTLDLGLFPDRGRFFFRLFNDAPGIGARLLELVLLLLISDPRNCKKNEGSDNKARDSSC